MKETNDLKKQCFEYVSSHIKPMPAFHRFAEIMPDDAEDFVEQNRGDSFLQTLFLFMDETGKKDSDIYKKAGIDRRHFSKIRSGSGAPGKRTVAALCLALELSRENADKLMSAAGYCLSDAYTFDLVIAFCLERKIYDFFDINELLDHFGSQPF